MSTPLACGCSRGDAAPIEPGTEVYCPNHGETVVPSAPLPLDVSGDLDAIPANRIGEPAASGS